MSQEIKKFDILGNMLIRLLSVCVSAQRVVLQQLQEVNGASQEIIMRIKCLIVFSTLFCTN